MRKNKKASGKSYVEFSLIGAYCSEYLSEAMDDGIRIYDIRNEKNVIYGRTAPKNYRRLAAMSRKYQVRIRIHSKSGVVLHAMTYKKRYGLLLGAFCYAVILILCSQIVWDIRIEGNTTISDELILENLAQNGVYAGAEGKSINCTLTELKMLMSLEKLAWISVENEGGRVYVKISERLDEPEITVPMETPCNVVASHSGQIIETQVYRGKMLYAIGSGVAKGDVIVSGVVDDGTGNLSYQHANGIIIAEYTETEEFYVPFIENKTVKTGAVHETEYLKFFSFTFPTRQIEAEENMVYTSEDHLVMLFGLEMPWKIRKIYAYETETIQVTHTPDRVREMLARQRENYEQNYLEDQQIVNTDVQYYPDEKGIKMTVTYTLRGDIAKLKEISID